MSSEELKCPWCGEEMRFDADSVHCWYKCDHCLAASPKVERVWDTTKHAIANWDENLKRAVACLKRVPQWNSVKENPPREGECVFCYYPYKAYGSKIMVDYNQAGEGATPHFSNQALWGRCTHWMPLSAPPDNEKEE